MATLIDETNIHRYSLVCTGNYGVINYFYVHLTKNVHSTFLGLRMDDITFESEERVIYVPFNLFEPLSLLKDNVEAQLHLLIATANDYYGENT